MYGFPARVDENDIALFAIPLCLSTMRGSKRPIKHPWKADLNLSHCFVDIDEAHDMRPAGDRTS